MKVIYRIADAQSSLSQPSPYPDSRQYQNEICLKSFVNSFVNTNINISFILDNCKEGWEKLLKKVPFEYDVIRTLDGIDQNCRRAVKMALEAKDDVIFQECDYLWVPNFGIDYIDAIKELGFVSPYDHPMDYIGVVLLQQLRPME
jgi:hypothetical protein